MILFYQLITSKHGVSTQVPISERENIKSNMLIPASLNKTWDLLPICYFHPIILQSQIHGPCCDCFFSSAHYIPPIVQHRQDCEKMHSARKLQELNSIESHQDSPVSIPTPRTVTTHPMVIGKHSGFTSSLNKIPFYAGKIIT